MNPELGLLATVLGASVLGSVHCIGMCGGFVAAACGTPGATGKRELGPLWAYQAARLVAYASLGAVAGALGAGLDQGAETILGLSRLAGPLMGVTLIAMAIAAWPGLLQHSTRDDEPLVMLGARGSRKPGLLARLRLKLTRLAARRGIAAGAAAGALSALLPCGWLWAYVAVAAATGRASLGALVMAAFWLGSVPALMSVGLLAETLRRRLGPHAAKIGALVMLGLGVLALFGKLGVEVELPQDHDQTEQARPDSPGETKAPEALDLPTEAPCH